MKKHIVFPFILCMCMFLTSCGVKMTGVKIQNVGELTTGDRQSLVLDYEFNHDGSDKEKEKVIDKTQLIFFLGQHERCKYSRRRKNNFGRNGRNGNYHSKESGRYHP